MIAWRVILLHGLKTFMLVRRREAMRGKENNSGLKYPSVLKT